MRRKRFLAEGNEDIYAIAELIGHFVDWPGKPTPPLVTGIQCNGEELFQGARIPTEIKSSDAALGVIFDADDNPIGRWNRIRGQVLQFFPDFPEIPPPNGLVISNADGKRFGVWMMPDNQQEGMLETFLRLLVPTRDGQLWEHAVAATDMADRHGRTYTDAHRDKANIHCWLAWIDPPGQSFGGALRARTLDANAPAAMAFANWFIDLFQLERLP